MIVEGISTNTALKARNSLVHHAKKLMDSSSIELPSNFRSFESNDNIQLRISMYGKQPKLESVCETLCEKLENEAWTPASREDKGKESHCYQKDSIMIKFFPVKKSFRSGAYKNREVPHLGIEVTGPKKPTLNMQ